MKRKRENIIFSTTRQWNPGDEVILAGIRNIFDSLSISYNPFIFNRNPDLRSGFDEIDAANGRERGLIGAPIDFFDNSIKPMTECKFAQWAIFAGTPEWCSPRTYDLYARILRDKIPVMILGVGGGFHPFANEVREVVAKAKTLVVRDAGTFKALTEAGYSPQQYPCPSLLSAPADDERAIDAVTKIGLIYQASRKDSVFGTTLDERNYAYQCEVYKQLIDKLRRKYEIAIVCHYIDEVPLAMRAFPNYEISYSFESRDYHSIYKQFDLVIGPRVHGIGAAASLGVPGVAIAHDARGGTCAGFLADIVDVGTNYNTVLGVIENAIRDISARNKRLLAHKAKTSAAYRKLVHSARASSAVAYDARLPTRKASGPLPTFTILERLDRTDAALAETQSLATSRAKEIEAVSERLSRTDSALGQAQNLAHARAGEIASLSERLVRTDVALAKAQSLAIQRAEEIGSLTEGLERTDASLGQAQSLAHARAGEIASLSGRLDDTDAALAEAQTLAIERAREIENLAGRLADTDAALGKAQTLAIERAVEIKSLSGRLDDTDAALAEAQTLAIERAREIENLAGRLADTDAALGKAQTLAIERAVEIKSLSGRLYDTDAALAEAQTLAIERAREIESLAGRLADTDAALAEAQALAVERAVEIESLSQRLAGTDAALAETQTLAVERAGEIENLAGRLTRTDAALAETQTLAVERAGEIESLAGRLTRTDAALAETQVLASERSKEVHRISATLEEISAAFSAAKCEVTALQAEIQAVYASLLWRSTRGVRAAVRLLLRERK